MLHVYSSHAHAFLNFTIFILITLHYTGFNDQEIVALSGAHALGRCHPTASGYDGPWTPTPTTFNNAYFTLLQNLNWIPKEWNGPYQYVDAPTGKLMMLPRYVRDGI
jgi:cytochrome c peroxidase